MTEMKWKCTFGAWLKESDSGRDPCQNFQLHLSSFLGKKHEVLSWLIKHVQWAHRPPWILKTNKTSTTLRSSQTEFESSDVFCQFPPSEQMGDSVELSSRWRLRNRWPLNCSQTGSSSENRDSSAGGSRRPGGDKVWLCLIFSETTEVSGDPTPLWSNRTIKGPRGGTLPGLEPPSCSHQDRFQVRSLGTCTPRCCRSRTGGTHGRTRLRPHVDTSGFCPTILFLQILRNRIFDIFRKLRSLRCVLFVCSWTHVSLI